MDIFEAIKTGNCAEMAKYLDTIKAVDKDGNTPLIVAAHFGHDSMVETLVECGAELDTRGKDLNSAMSLASKAGHAKVVIKLLNAGASVNTSNENGETPLHLAMKGGHESIVTMLLDHGADITVVDKVDGPIACGAVCKSTLSMLKLLLQRGADKDCRTKAGSTPLISAAYYENHLAVLLLLQHGADPNFSTSEIGNSALTWSSERGSYATAKALLDAGANPIHKTKGGQTPLSIAKDELMKRLICAYQAGGPSWLVQQLCARGLEWPVVCDIEDKLLQEGFVSKDIFLAAPMSLFTHEYLRSLGITHFGTRLVVIAIRLEGTWLGARLAGLGVSPFWIRSCETCVFEALGCRTKTAYASLPVAAFTAEALLEVGVPAQYHLVLRTVHKQLGKAREEKKSNAAPAVVGGSICASSSVSANAVNGEQLRRI